MSDYDRKNSLTNCDSISDTTLCGHLQAFKYLFSTPEKVNQKQSSKEYYLAHNAAATGNLDLLKWTFKNTKSKITDQDDEGLTILHVAALTSKLNITEWILQFTHLSPVLRTEEGSTALHFACWSGGFEITKRLIEIEPRLINMRMNNGATAAIYASQGGFIDIMEFLLNSGANFGLSTKYGVNCLHMAAQQGHLEAVKWLVENTGLHLHGKDRNGITPIHYAAVENRHEVVSWLLEKEVRLLRERFIDDCQHSVSISESTMSIEDVISSKNKVSVKQICEFSALESVQDKLSMIFSEYNPNLTKNQETDYSGLIHCCIPLGVLLLLQSALIDLRSQYQKMIRQSYLSEKVSGEEQISKEIQTTETSNWNIQEFNTIPYTYQIPRPVRCQKDEFVENNDEDPLAPPPPPTEPPQINSIVTDSPTLSLSYPYQNRTYGKPLKMHRRGSSTDDIKTSLIQELKKINHLRSKNNQSLFLNEDDKLTSSNTDSIIINDNILSQKSPVRNPITDSAPNLLSIFNSTGNSCSGLVIPKWKLDLTTKPTSNKLKEENHSKVVNEIPSWMHQIIEKRALSPNTPKQLSTLPIPPQIAKDISLSPGVSKVTQLVHQWQNTTS